MTGETPAVRASDAERERIVGLLRTHAVDGRLTLEEFAQRVDAAYGARTRDELETLTTDLPAEAAVSSAAKRSRRPKRLSGVVFGHVERKGRWRMPRFSAVVVIFGDADVDLRSAEIGGNVVTITALIAFGNADFFVPEGVEVDLGGFSVFGHRREHGADVAPAQAAPLVRIRVFSAFGTSDVWRVPAGTSGSYRELIRSLQDKRRLSAG